VSVLCNLPFGMGSNFMWWNLEGALDEFSNLLKIQLDFRKESENLERFNANFRNDPHVVFPKSVKGFDAHPDVLVETYVEGMPISKFMREHGENKALLHKMCIIGIETVCRMIFYHNFVHADLHPGNILASVSEDGVPKFILLDVGMITEFKDEDYDNLIDILASFIRRNGRRAAELMIQDSEKKMSSNQLNEQAVINREKFISKIQYLTDSDRDISFFENIGGYILYICDAAATHHVRLNEAFASMALAIKVQEGVAISLDPMCHVWETANPIIVKAETRRRFNRMIRHISDEILSFNVRSILQDRAAGGIERMD
jgi:aarF domain-containing kinase